MWIRRNSFRFIRLELLWLAFINVKTKEAVSVGWEGASQGRCWRECLALGGGGRKPLQYQAHSPVSPVYLHPLFSFRPAPYSPIHPPSVSPPPKYLWLTRVEARNCGNPELRVLIKSKGLSACQKPPFNFLITTNMNQHQLHQIPSEWFSNAFKAPNWGKYWIPSKLNINFNPSLIPSHFNNCR